MRPLRTLLAVAAAVVLPTAAHAQACTPAELAANPLVALGYRAFVRINSSAFDLSCYYAVGGAGQVGFTTASPSVAIGSGTNEYRATISQLVFQVGPEAQLNYGVSSNIGRTAVSPVDFVFAFAAPLSSLNYATADAQIGITRASGNPNVSIVPVGAASTNALGGSVPSYVRAGSSYVAVSGGGSAANPFALDLGVNVGNSACTTGTACSYAAATSSPDAALSAWGTVVSYRQTRTTTRASNAQVNGQVGITATPEPATVGLMATGLLALGGVGYGRRRRA